MAPMILKLGNRKLSLDRPRVMGVLNVTPDSFSDGGEFLRPDDAVQRALQMQQEGADIVDVGGESTRPGADEVSVQEEIDRTSTVIEVVSSELDVSVSIDTSKPEVMRVACAAGATLVNDVYALRRNGAIQAVADLEVPVCLMHMQGEPRNMQECPDYEELPGDIVRFLKDRIDACVGAGIQRDRLLVDPGFGFGKNDAHNLKILANLDQFSVLSLPLLVGLSRKRLLGSITGRSVDERVSAGLAAAVLAVTKGANIVRTHDVAATVDALRVTRAVLESRQSDGQ